MSTKQANPAPTVKYAADEMDDFLDGKDAVQGGGRIPKFPEVKGVFECVAKRLRPAKTPMGKKLIEFTFLVTKSSHELVFAGSTYSLAFFPGDDDVSKAMCGRKMRPVLAALAGKSSNDPGFKAGEARGEFYEISSLGDLDLPFKLQRDLQPAKPGKDGVVKHVDDNGNPKIFAEDSFSPFAG
jgi:hypothetical protein